MKAFAVGMQLFDGLQQVQDAFPGVDAAVIQHDRWIVCRGAGGEAFGFHGAGDDGEAGRVGAETIDHFGAEGVATDQDGTGMIEHARHGEAMGFAAAADPVAVAALDGDDVGNAGLAGGEQRGPASGIAVLRVQHVERDAAVFGDDRVAHGDDIALEVAGGLLAELFQADDADALDLGGRPAAIDAFAEIVAAGTG